MGRIWESINASNQHMLTHVPNGQIAGSPLCRECACLFGGCDIHDREISPKNAGSQCPSSTYRG